MLWFGAIHIKYKGVKNLHMLKVLIRVVEESGGSWMLRILAISIEFIGVLDLDIFKVFIGGVKDTWRCLARVVVPD